MTKKQLQQLQNIQYSLKKGIDYLKKDSTLVCSDSLPHNLSFYNKDGKGITPMNKFVGTDLCYLYNALQNITEIILSEQKVKIPVTAL